MTARPPVALTIAGSDSSGGAGIQADLKTFHALGVYGASAITALTAQNTEGVDGVLAVDPSFVALQIDAVARDLPVGAVKTGMLANAGIAAVVADAADRWSFPFLVVDPVMVATTGARLLDPAAIEAVRSLLLPRATIVTPNGPEAAALLGFAVETPADQEKAARALVGECGAPAALVKGGDLAGARVVDVFCDAGGVVVYDEPRIATRAGHGAGCALASAIAAWLARGEPLEEAVVRARAFVRRGLEAAPALGHGRHPLDLFG